MMLLQQWSHWHAQADMRGAGVKGLTTKQEHNAFQPCCLETVDIVIIQQQQH